MLRKWLGIADLREELAEIRDAQETIENRVDELEDRLDAKADADVFRQEVKQISDRIDALENTVTGEENTGSNDPSFSKGEKQVLRVLLEEKRFLSAQQIAERVDKSAGTIRKYLSRLREKITLQEQQDGRTKTYKLDADAEKGILGQDQKQFI